MSTATATLSTDESLAAWDAGYEWASANPDKAQALVNDKALDAVFRAVCEDREWAYDEETDPAFWDRYHEVVNAAKAALPNDADNG